MINLIASILGASLAIVFVGYFAISVGKIPLLIIVAVCLCLMLVATYQDLRDSWNAR